MDIKKIAFGGVALAAGLSLTLSATPAMAVTSTHSFEVNTMTTDSSATVDASATSGDDGGFLAVTPDVLLRDGNDGVYSYNKNSLAAIAGTTGTSKFNVLFSDLTTEIAYEFISSSETSGPITGAYELDGNGNRTATQLSFTEEIPTDNGDRWVAASGAGQVAFWNGTTGDIWVVSLPSGTLTKVTGKALFADFANAPADNSEDVPVDQAGILEFDCVDYSFLLLDANTESFTRYNTSTAATEVLLAAGPLDGKDTDTIMVSPSDSRWYIHSEGQGQVFGITVPGMSEAIVSAAATFTSEVCPAADEKLAATGVSENAGIWAASAALIAGLGVAGGFMIRRRQA